MGTFKRLCAHTACGTSFRAVSRQLAPEHQKPEAVSELQADPFLRGRCDVPSQNCLNPKPFNILGPLGVVRGAPAHPGLLPKCRAHRGTAELKGTVPPAPWRTEGLGQLCSSNSDLPKAGRVATGDPLQLCSDAVLQLIWEFPKLGGVPSWGS